MSNAIATIARIIVCFYCDTRTTWDAAHLTPYGKTCCRACYEEFHVAGPVLADIYGGIDAAVSANRDAALAVWKQVGYALDQHNARGRAASKGKARRMLAELLGAEHADPSTGSLETYYEKLDAAVWPTV